MTVLFVLVGTGFALSQSVHIDQLNKDFTSYLHPVLLASADSILNASEFTISLSSLKKQCDSPNSCYEVSIIEEAHDLSDSLLWNPLVCLIRTDLFDSIVPLRNADSDVVLEQILMGSPPDHDENQLIHICYNPRHAILIKDAAGKIIVVYEVCFECEKSKVAFSRLEWLDGIPSVISEIFWRYGLK